MGLSGGDGFWIVLGKGDWEAKAVTERRITMTIKTAGSKSKPTVYQPKHVHPHPQKRTQTPHQSTPALAPRTPTPNHHPHLHPRPSLRHPSLPWLRPEQTENQNHASLKA